MQTAGGTGSKFFNFHLWVSPFVKVFSGKMILGGKEFKHKFN